MFDTKIIASAANAALAVAKVLPMGGPAIAAGKAVLDLVNEIRDTAGADADRVAELEAGREALERAVNDHARRTADSLGDG